MAQDQQKFIPGKGMVKAPGGYQSEEAEEKAAEAARVVIDDTPPQPAVIPTVKPTEVIKTEDSFKMVKVKPRQNMLRMRVGKEWYSFVAGRECLVPKHVAILLEEKGLL